SCCGSSGGARQRTNGGGTVAGARPARADARPCRRSPRTLRPRATPSARPRKQTRDLAAVPQGRSDRPLPRGPVRVIGVAEDVTNGTIFEGLDASCVYFPTDVPALTDMWLLVRARTDDVEALRLAVTTAVKEVAPETPF